MGKERITAFPLGDAEMVSACLAAVKEFCDNRKSLGDFNVDRCLEKALAEFKAQYRKARGYTKSSAMKPEHVAEIDELYFRLWPTIEDGAREMSLKYATRHKALQVTKTTASAYITEVMAEAGFESCSILCQCFRAKVVVRLPSGYNAMLIVRYKDIMAGKLDGIVKDFLSLTETIASLPFTVKIWK